MREERERGAGCGTLGLAGRETPKLRHSTSDKSPGINGSGLCENQATRLRQIERDDTMLRGHGDSAERKNDERDQ